MKKLRYFLKNKKGLTGLETAIILIAFVIVASAFAFTVLNMGILSSQRSKEVIGTGMAEASSVLELDGSVIANSTNKQVDSIIFYIKTSAGKHPVDLSTTTATISYTSPHIHEDNVYDNTTKAFIYEVKGDGDTLLEYGEKFKVVAPEIYVDNALQPIRPNEIYYSNISDIFTQYTIVTALNVADENSFPNFKAILTGPASCIYMSYENLYVSMSNWSENGTVTVIHKIRIHGDEIHPAASGKVPGRVLNQFSMDEYKGLFRIATTVSKFTIKNLYERLKHYASHRITFVAELLKSRFMVFRSTQYNNLYILNETLDIISKIEDIAPGERIYAARFMGNIVFLVTYRRIDPLFAINVSDPYHPKIIGFLKIPGYSEYLHPYGDKYLIGIGFEGTNTGRFIGFKISLFDISDLKNISEVSRLIYKNITYSHALYDHKAFTINNDEGYFMIPVRGVHGSGILVIDIRDGKLVEHGFIRHQDAFRSIYIEDYIVSISGSLLKFIDYKSMKLINEVELS